MTMTLSLSSVTSTSATIAISGEAADGTNDFQLAARPDFQWCVCPIFNLARGTPRTFDWLNQRATLYLRARSVRASGTIEGWSNILGLRTADGAAQDTAPAAIMVEPALFAVPAPLLSITASTTLAGFPATNLLRDAPVAWRGLAAPDAGTYVASFVMETGGEPIDTVALMSTNLPESALVTITGSNNAAISSGNVAFATSAAFRASANLPGRAAYHGLFRGSPIAKRFWKIEVRTAMQFVVEIQHLVLGLNRGSKNHALDKSETGINLGTLERARSGIADFQDGFRMRRVEFDIALMSETQYETLYGDLVYRVNEPVLVVPNSKAGGFLHDRILYGRLSGGRAVQPASPRYTRSFTIDSII